MQRAATTCFSSARIVSYRVPVMSPHAHDEDSLCLPLSGHYLERTRGRETRHRLGDILYCPAGELHSQQFADVRTAKLLLRPTAEARDYLGHYLDLSEAPFAREAALIPLTLRFAYELRESDPQSAIIADGLGYELLGHFARSRQRSAIAGRWLEAARDYVRAHACGPLSLAAAARHVGRSPGELARSYRSAFGRSIGEDARAMRLKKAATLLSADALPLAEIAVCCGYFDQAHFSRAFKSAYGITPGAFRRMMH